MKQKIRLGNCYALTKHKPKHHHLRYIGLLAILTSMCLYAVKQASAQQAGPAATAVSDIKPLQVGDTIPEWLWHYPLPYWNGPGTGTTLRLDDFNDRKLILIDFWASFCTTCLNGFPLLDSLQREHQEDMQVILINPGPAEDSPRRIVKALSRRLSIPLELPIIFPDTEVHPFFGVRAVPLYIWIDQQRVVRAITKKAGVSAETIQAFINNQHP